MATKRDKQVEVFIKQAEQVAREWTLAEIQGEDTHPLYANRMFLVHQLAKEVLAAEDDKEAEV